MITFSEFIFSGEIPNNSRSFSIRNPMKKLEPSITPTIRVPIGELTRSILMGYVENPKFKLVKNLLYRQEPDFPYTMANIEEVANLKELANYIINSDIEELGHKEIAKLILKRISDIL